jgi:hypothetical protein
MVLSLLIYLFFLSTSKALYRVQQSSSRINDNNTLRRKLGYPPLGSNCSVAGPSRNAGSRIISGKVTLYHVFIGLAGDYSASSSRVLLLQKFATDLSGSMFANIMLGYGDSFGNISSTNYVFGGSHFETLAANTVSLNDTVVYNVVNNARNTKTGWQTGVGQSLYLVVFNGRLAYASSITGGSAWNTATGWCGFHSNDLSTGTSVFSNKDLIIMPVGGSMICKFDIN